MRPRSSGFGQPQLSKVLGADERGDLADQVTARRAAADAVEARVRSNRRALAEEIAGRWPDPRAVALLETDPVEDRYRAALSDSAPPFERARAALSFGQWLRRTRQSTRARTQLRLGRTLTPQEQAVVRLAAKGMSNREIGERLFLSPRTVGYHLYKVFPKLGVSCRAQLRDIVV